jgi:hypothetical protein
MPLLRRALLALAFIFTALALALVVTGGFVTSMLGVRLSARSPLPAAIAATGAAVTWLTMARRAGRTTDDLVDLDRWLTTHASKSVAAIAGVGAAIAVCFATFSANGSDASGYLSHAEMLGQGRLERPEPLAAVADWPDAASTLTPLGWWPAARAGFQVPTYAVGLPLLMVPLDWIGGPTLACLVVPLAFAVALWCTGRLAGALAGPGASLIATIWLATSPVALLEAMQPMSDVPTMAAWVVCWSVLLQPTRDPARRQPAQATIAGAAAALAVLIRPNLAPVAAVPALWLLLAARDEPLRARFRRAIAFSIPVAVAGCVIAYLQWRWFGSPLRSGYGTAGQLYAVTNATQNAVVYSRWLFETHGPWLFLAPLAALGSRQRSMRWLLVFAALVVAAYLIYGVFEVWAYLRFLLPALAIFMIAVAALVARLLARAPAPARAPLLITAVLAIAAMNVASARERGVFRQASRDARAVMAGQYLAATVPPRGVIIAGEQSGSMRYYSGRSILRWEVLTPGTLTAAERRLTETGHELWVALDDWEEEPFRRRLGATRIGALEWPPAVDAGGEVRTRVWRVRDRDRFLAGERVITDRLR